ncbi:GNAT family N-acetyltransferase [Halobacillus yeomjeoni]|uniref:GNAT family N-acetyltransferase n=1 Tax=Halobacillus yeomjeoni TaxID=311194 RepID=A0A931HX31_9BACI|nr:GNAT family protein [Halobacillus yeomjeoni]MBH0231245.1 GNAT family N-acetyltransferase [Halobacillus yeomjeoni]
MFKYIIDQDLTLKPLEFKDAEELFNLSDRSRAHLQTWLPWIHETESVQDTKEYIQYCMNRYAENNGWTICILYKNKIAGIVDFHQLDWMNNKASIGYWMGSEYAGKGLLTRSCKVIFDYAFKQMGMNRIEIRAAEENVKSRAVPERLGFEQEGIIRDAAFLYDRHVNHVVYGMLEKDWMMAETSGGGVYESK